MSVRPYAALLLCALAAAMAAASSRAPECKPAPRQSAGPHLYWPRFPRPTKVWVVPEPASRDETVLLLTLSGLVARAERAGRTSEMIWMTPANNPPYARWLEAMKRQTHAETAPLDTWTLLKRFINTKVVKGYALCRSADSSLTVATTACAPLDAVAVAEPLEARVKELGIPQALDARAMSEEQAFDKFKDSYNRGAMALQDPANPYGRDAIVALGMFAASGDGPLYNRVLEWLQPESPIFGWGLGDEFSKTSSASRWGDFQTASDFCLNLPALSTETPGVTLEAARLRKPAQHTLWDLAWEDDVHYATLLLSDGDNVQFLMGGFHSTPQQLYYDCPERGKLPFGWTLCYDNLAQLDPYALEAIFQAATPNDDFVLFSGGYYYPDHFGASRPDQDLLAKHAAHVGEYMRMGGLNTLMLLFGQWDSAAAINSYGVFAKQIPGLAGFFAASYAPYVGGRGNMLFIADGRGDEVPVFSTRFCIWNHQSDTNMSTPTRIAQAINGLKHRGEPNHSDSFSTVMVHAWSWFKQPATPGGPSEEVDQSQGGQPGTRAGYWCAKWCKDALAPHVRVLTPNDFCLMARLRMKPRQTLSRALATLAAEIRRGRAAFRSAPKLDKAAAYLAEAQRALQAVEYRNCFELGKKAHAVLATL